MAARLPSLLLTLALLGAAADATAQSRYRRVLRNGRWVMVEDTVQGTRTVSAGSQETRTRTRSSTAARARASGRSSSVGSVAVPPPPNYQGPHIPWRWEGPVEDPNRQEAMDTLVFDLAHANIKGEWERVRDFFQQIRALARDTADTPDVEALEIHPEVYRLSGEAYRRAGDWITFLRIQDGYLPLLARDAPVLPTVLSELALVLDTVHSPLGGSSVAQVHADVATLRTLLSTPRPPASLEAAARRARARAAQRLARWRIEGEEHDQARRRLRLRWPQMVSRVRWVRASEKRHERYARIRQEEAQLRADRRDHHRRMYDESSQAHQRFLRDANAYYRDEYAPYADAVRRQEESIEAARRADYEARRAAALEQYQQLEDAQREALEARYEQGLSGWSGRRRALEQEAAAAGRRPVDGSDARAAERAGMSSLLSEGES